MKVNKKFYYDIAEDLKAFPDCIIYLIIGGRFRGKTYSTLKKLYEDKTRFLFMKRTKEDIKLIYSAEDEDASKETQSLAPFKALNRDLGCNVQAKKINESIGGFYEDDEFLGYICAMTQVSKYKGMDLSDVECIVFDEFIPAKYDRINRDEGIALLDLYATVSRDRELRGLAPLKLICLANATSISNPIFNTLEIVDKVAELNQQPEGYWTARNILVHKVGEVKEATEKLKIAETMEGTKWLDVSFGNSFAYDDFSKVAKRTLKNYTPLCSFTYGHQHFYIYYNNGRYRGCENKFTAQRPEYNLDIETECIAFYNDYGIDLRIACIDGYMDFSSYLIYDLIVNFKKYFKV